MTLTPVCTLPKTKPTRAGRALLTLIGRSSLDKPGAAPRLGGEWPGVS